MRKMGFIFILCLLVCGCSAKLRLEKGQTWDDERKPVDPLHSTKASALFDKLWVAEFNGKVIAPLVVGSEFISVPTSKDKIRFYNILTGKNAGHARVKGSSQAGFIIGDSIAVTCSAPPRNRLVCKNMRSLDDLWKGRIKDITGGSITKDNQLVISSGLGVAYCIDLITGKEVWKYETKSLTKSAPMVVDDLVIQTTDKGNVIGIDMKDGSLKYEFSMPHPCESAVTIGDKGFVVDIVGNVTAFDPANGSIFWTSTVAEPTWSSPAVDSNLCILTTRTGKVIALDNSSGKTLWVYEATDVIKTSAAICDEFIVAGTLSGFVVSLSKSDGHKLDQVELDGPVAVPPVFDREPGGCSRVFVATNAGSLYCFGAQNIAEGVPK